jgi:hypothetical protein
MGQVTHDQANLLLKLYDLRREPRLRQARAWFIGEFRATTPEEMAAKYPPGSEENTSFRMALSYWDMVASIVNRGLIDDEFFFESNGEAWVVWERIKQIVPALRTAFKNPHNFENLESMVQRMESWRERRAPGSTVAMRQMMEQMMRGTARAASD